MICRLPKSLLPVEIMAKNRHATCGTKMWPLGLWLRGQSMELRFQHLQCNSWLSASLLPQRVPRICFSSRTPCYGLHPAVVHCIHVSFFYHHHCICWCNLHFTIANIIYYLVFYNVWQRSQSIEFLLTHLRKSIFSWWTRKLPLWGLTCCKQSNLFFP